MLGSSVRLTPNYSHVDIKLLLLISKKFDLLIDLSREKMPLTTQDQLTIEKSPAYFHSKIAAERIRALNPAMKIIIVVRDPVMRAISGELHSSVFKKENAWNDANVRGHGSWRLRPMAKDELFSKVGGVNVGWGAIRIGVYHKHMKRWLDNFPMQQIHIVDGERLVTQPAMEVSQTERFLGLEPG
ncbi:hypothetical protein ANCDUO_25917, partial [Ancylostoma duodenale]